MSFYTVHLVNISMIRPAPLVRRVIERALAPIVQTAGHELNMVNVREAGRCDVSIEFVRNPQRMGAQFFGPLVLAEQSGAVLVGNILEMRAGGEQGFRVGFIGATQPLFQNGDDAFARCVGNVAVHELGHTIGGLKHKRNPSNYMYTGAFLRDDFPHSWFSLDNLRRHWSSERTFRVGQTEKLVEAIRRGELQGVEMERIP